MRHPSNQSLVSFVHVSSCSDLAPPATDASTKPASDAATTPAAKVPTVKETAATTSTAATPTAKPDSGAGAASTTTVGGAQFQGASANDNEALKAEIEKRKSRAARFGTSLTEQDKALERAARFGVPVAATTTASLAKAAGTAVPPAKTATATAAGAAKSGVPSKPGSVASQVIILRGQFPEGGAVDKYNYHSLIVVCRQFYGE
jgi:hypothetical protein